MVAFAASTLDPHTITRADQRTVAIEIRPCFEAVTAQQSGFVIDDETVVTVAHAVYESRELRVGDSTGRWYEPEIVRLDLERDLAVLRVAGLGANALESAPPRPTDAWKQLKVRMLGGSASGYGPGELARRVNLTTEVIGDRTQTTARKGYQVRLSTKPGDSGAAIVDAQDRLVAVVFARSRRHVDTTWATAAEEIDLSPAPIPAWSCPGLDPH